MTTVALRGGVMSADSRTTPGLCDEGLCKVRLVGEWVVGFAGNTIMIDHVVEQLWIVLRPGERPPTVLMDLSAIASDCATENGDYLMLLLHHPRAGSFWAETTTRAQLMCSEVTGEFHAIGSGAQFALCAMLAGADSAEAVRIACLMDTKSELPVRSFGSPVA